MNQLLKLQFITLETCNLIKLILYTNKTLQYVFKGFNV